MCDSAYSCPICFEYYSGGREPVMLPRCGHTLCRICLVSIPTTACPICRTVHFGTPLNLLPTNFIVLNLNSKEHVKSATSNRIGIDTASSVSTVGGTMGVIETSHSVISAATRPTPTTAKHYGPIILVTAFSSTLSAFLIAMIVIGAIEWHNCPAQGFLPVYLVVGGATALLMASHALFRYIVGRPKSVEIVLFTIYTMFYLAWFTTGCILVYSMFPPLYASLDNSQYCTSILFFFTFWQINSHFILVGFVLLIWFVYLLYIFFSTLDTRLLGIR